MKRIVSFMLAAVLVLAPCMQSFATGDIAPAVEGPGSPEDPAPPGTDNQTTPPNGNDQTTPPDKTTGSGAGEDNGGGDTLVPPDTNIPAGAGGNSGDIVPIGEMETEKTDQGVTKGQIDVYIMQSLVFKDDITYTVKLKDQI